MTEDDPIARFAERHRLGAVALRELRTLTDTLADESWGTVPQLAAARDEAPTLADPQPAVGPFDPGSPRYALEGELGAGNQGVVYRVLDRKLQRSLAMKVLRAGASMRSWTRFRNEITLTVGLEHPGIVPIYDTGATDDGRPWFTMPILHGVEFGAIIGDRAQSLRHRLAMFLRACEAVAHAHARGVMHRDLKPGNIMIGPLGAVRVLDWGLARRTGERVGPRQADGELDPLMTPDGALIGTPRYMAPEQLAGAPDRMTQGTDVYALGLMLAQLITGAPPAGRNLVAIFDLRRRDLAPPASGPAPLRALCAHATRVEPSRRPAHAGELADGIRDWLDSR